MCDDCMNQTESLVARLPRDASFGKAIYQYLVTMDPDEQGSEFASACMLGPWRKETSAAKDPLKPGDETEEKGARYFQRLRAWVEREDEEGQCRKLWELIQRPKIELDEGEVLELNDDLRGAIAAAAILSRTFPKICFTKNMIEDPDPARDRPGPLSKWYFNFLPEDLREKLDRMIRSSRIYLLFAHNLWVFLAEEVPERRYKAAALAFASLRVFQLQFMGHLKMKMPSLSYDIVNKGYAGTIPEIKMIVMPLVRMEAICCALGVQGVYYVSYKLIYLMEKYSKLPDKPKALLMGSMLWTLCGVYSGEYGPECCAEEEE